MKESGGHFLLQLKSQSKLFLSVSVSLSVLCMLVCIHLCVYGRHRSVSGVSLPVPTTFV